ncbi:MAG: hypothetical protein F4X44_02640 [Gammaproteobacteria bacterium]|nr:hypothetical protein [Gammaproteobacteria bacterium]MYD79493.1 hypothetical protein [Gammaproteobacteria bacterium]
MRTLREKLGFWGYRLLIAWSCINACVLGPIACYLIFAYCNGCGHVKASVYSAMWLASGMLLLTWSANTSAFMKDHIYWTFQIPLIVKGARQIMSAIKR